MHVPPPSDHLSGAIALLDRYGPADPSPSLSVQAVADACGVTRSTIYRHWETVDELNDDLAAFFACNRTPWQRRLLDQPVEQGFGASVRAAVGHPARELGLLLRALAAGWPAGLASRDLIAEWERIWLDQ